MNITNFKKVFPFLMQAKISPLLWSKPGTGKTNVAKQIAKSLSDGEGYNFVYLTLGAVEDNSDLIGLLSPLKDELGNDVAVRHLRPDWFPTSPNNIILIDEVNRTPKSVIPCLLAFINEGKLHNHYLPANSHFILTANPPSDDHIVNDISDTALVSRMCHISLEPTVEEFLEFCASTGKSDDVISFIQENPEMLEKQTPSYLPDIEPYRRTWADFVSPFVLSNPPKELIFEVVRGLVGVAGAVKFQNHCKNSQFKIKGKEVLNEYNVVLSNRVKSHQNDLDVLNIASEELVREIKLNKGVTEKQGKNVVEFLLDLPIELGYNVARQVLDLGFFSLNQYIGENSVLVDRIRNKIDKL